MANLAQQSEWVEGIYRLETSDPVLGGESGISNLQAKQLGNRTAYLKEQVEGKAAADHNHDETYASADHSHDETYATPEYVQTMATPVGAVLIWPLGAEPSGYLPCEGAAVSREDYANLFAVIGTTYGDGNGETTFNLPDYRGYFLRGFDNGAGVDTDAADRTDRGDGTTGDNVGTAQAAAENSIDSIKTECVYQGADWGEAEIPDDGSYSEVVCTGTDQHGYRTETAIKKTGNETRPINKSVLFVIKY